MLSCSVAHKSACFYCVGLVFFSPAAPKDIIGQAGGIFWANIGCTTSRERNFIRDNLGKGAHKLMTMEGEGAHIYTDLHFRQEPNQAT